MNVEKSKGYVRITVTDVALKNPDIMRAMKALLRAMEDGRALPSGTTTVDLDVLQESALAIAQATIQNANG